MWLVDSWVFRGSGLYTNKACLIRDLSLTEFDTERSLVHLYSGEYGDEYGGCIALRRLGEHLFWMPEFSELATPPHYMHYEGSPFWSSDCCGIPILTAQQYRLLRTNSPRFPEFSQIPLLSIMDAVRILQWTAPASILGQVDGPPTLRRRDVLAVTEGDQDEECTAVQKFLDVSMETSGVLVPVQSDVIPIEFHLDTPNFRAWSPLVRFNEAELAFNLEPLGSFAWQA